MTYDTIIIGAGPAGFTAGIYAARREMKTLIIGATMGGQMLWASEIENYPGFKSIKSFELVNKMKEQAESFGVEIKTDEVKRIEKERDVFKVHTEKESYEAKTVIAALGASPRRLAIPGEEEFKGRGVTYCANCDGPFYKDKVVAVVGGGNSALDAAEIMGKIAKKVYLIHRNEEFRAFETLIKQVQEKENIKCLLNSEVKEIIGEAKVNKIKVLNNKTNEEKEIELNGIFIEIGHIAEVDLVKDFVDIDEQNEVIVDEKCATKTPGLYAAGDITQIPYKQITIAAGQATIAALAAYQYIQLKAGKEAKIIDRGHH
ncbi:thioredoxin-disulfide reductase [Candidatus Falkowbacteria bacterium]|nr:thioredoxin-disulfide reductase [Candidatus Falkowbacteria bacterium]